MEPNDNFDDFDTQIQSDELIPEYWDEAEEASARFNEGLADALDLDNDAYGDDRDGYDGGDDFPF